VPDYATAGQSTRLLKPQKFWLRSRHRVTLCSLREVALREQNA